MAKSKRALDFVQPHLLTLQPYEAVDPPEVLARRAGIAEAGIIKLDANENPYGASPKVSEALEGLKLRSLPLGLIRDCGPDVPFL